MSKITLSLYGVKVLLLFLRKIMIHSLGKFRKSLFTFDIINSSKNKVKARAFLM